MRAFIRSRNMIPLTWICFGSLALIFSPWGSAPSPYLDLGVPGPLVPLRAVAVVAVGYLPLLALAPETRIPDLSSPRSTWLLQSLAPTVLTLAVAAAAAAGAAIADVDALAAVRNLLLGTAVAGALYRAMGPLSFVPPVLGALFCAALREQHAWWSITNQQGTVASFLIALGLAAVSLQFGAIRRT
jgi:hypothetical protein